MISFGVLLVAEVSCPKFCDGFASFYDFLARYYSASFLTYCISRLLEGVNKPGTRIEARGVG